MLISKALKASGLALLAGPLSLALGSAVFAQDYVDLEAERAAAKSGGTTTTTDPYGARPATAYPATSYGVNSSAPAPLATVAQPQSQTQPAGTQDLSNLFYQLQQLQQEVMMLNGKVEEQAHELRSLKEQSLERYVDLDRRIAGGAATVPASNSGGSASTSPAVVTPISGSSAVAEQAGEGEAYRSAYALVRSQKFNDATGAFKQFLQDYPAGKYAPNAHYWLGELYLVMQPADLESSRQAFMLLLSQYPDNSKAPDAMYKLGKVYFQKGNREKAREYLDRVISQYGTTNSSAVKLSRDFIAQNY
ncbi:MAG: tol-pal system protein YbgF [Gammaproteobacteria bacterium]|nr:MAG: tol-pal system protein YbgF [Gammaproteobacteria bacterium]